MKLVTKTLFNHLCEFFDILKFIKYDKTNFKNQNSIIKNRMV